MTPPAVVIGANGQLGTDLCREFSHYGSKGAMVPFTRADFDVRHHDRVADALEALRPSVIVNTAAFHKVEACETDVEQAFDVNCIAVRNLAMVAERVGARLIHLSTDYVFDGESSLPYSETESPNPLNVYGTSKAAGEFFVRNLCSRHLIVRTSGLYGLAGSSGKGGNFVQTMLRLGRERGDVSVVNDQVLSPTFTLDLAQKIWEVAAADAQGVYHVTSSGWCSWYEFARAIFELCEMQVSVHPIDTSSSGSPVRRPRFSALANARLESEGFGPMRSWKEALASYLQAVNQPVVSGAQSGHN